MKLILCLECHDVVKIGTRGERRYCLCKKSWGVYKEDGRCAVIGGQAVPLGLDNITLSKGVRNCPKDGTGPSVMAWVFPIEYSRIEVEGKPLSEKPKRVILRLPPDLVEWVDRQVLFQQARAEMKTGKTLEARVNALEEKMSAMEAD